MQLQKLLYRLCRQMLFKRSSLLINGAFCLCCFAVVYDILENVQLLHIARAWVFCLCFLLFCFLLQEDFSFYKNLLQELTQKEGCPLPVYTTTRSGEAHASTFVSIVEVKGNVFTGQEAKTKKHAEVLAAKVAYMKLKERMCRKLPVPHFLFEKNKNKKKKETFFNHTVDCLSFSLPFLIFMFELHCKLAFGRHRRMKFVWPGCSKGINIWVPWHAILKFYHIVEKDDLCSASPDKQVKGKETFHFLCPKWIYWSMSLLKIGSFCAGTIKIFVKLETLITFRTCMLILLGKLTLLEIIILPIFSLVIRQQHLGKVGLWSES